MISLNAFSMSTDYLPLANGKLWNVMLQRETSSLSTNISQSYKLYAGLQHRSRIEHFSVTSMSISPSRKTVATLPSSVIL